MTSLLQATLVYSLPFASFHKSVKFTVIFISLEFYFIIFFFIQDGLLRVVLDGGPSRIFSLGDAKLLEEDLEVLKVPALCPLNIASGKFLLVYTPHMWVNSYLSS